MFSNGTPWAGVVSYMSKIVVNVLITDIQGKYQFK